MMPTPARVSLPLARSSPPKRSALRASRGRGPSRWSAAGACAAIVISVALAACDDDASPPRDLPNASSPPPRGAAALPDLPGAGDTTTSAGDTAASAGSTSTASGAPNWTVLAGAWEGAYDAKKGQVDMPKGVKDPARAADDGKRWAGPGLVKLTVTADGDVTGKSQGALGNASLRGKMDGKMLRASFLPDDPTAPGAMTGVLVGPLKDGVVQAELRVAGSDALVVRQANFQIKKK